jgi:Fasciclin domain
MFHCCTKRSIANFIHSCCFRYVHFITQLPLPRSVTHTVYDIAKEDPQFTTQISYIDTLRLDSDMKRLLPLTTFFAPNDAFEGKVTKIEEIAEALLESHIFEKLLWCQTIIDLAGSTITSYNNQSWTVSVGKSGMPCFDTYAGADGTIKKSCITKCDTLARNGIVHEVDELLLFNPAETRPPSTFGDFPNVNAPTAPSPPTVFQRPSQSSIDNAPGASPSDGDDISFGAGEQSNALIGQSMVTVVAIMVGITVINTFLA